MTSPVLVTCTSRLRLDTSGQVRSRLTAFSHEFWGRYTEVFSEVSVFARVERGVSEASWPLVESAEVTVWRVPFTSWVTSLFSVLREAVRAARWARRSRAAVILRLPCPTATFLWLVLLAFRVPYAVEVVGDPHDSFHPAAVDRARLRARVLRVIWPRLMRLQVRRSNGAAYVTQHVLQKRYPCRSTVASAAYSSIRLLPRDRRHEPRVYGEWTRGTVRLVSVGSLAHLYKGPHVLVEALGVLVKRGWDVHMTWVGGGSHMDQIAALARRRGVGNRVHLLGHVADHRRVIRTLDEADVFVLPSLQEGLPRALIEAMARGMACVGSDAGGIPELLHPRALVPRADFDALADTLASLCRDTDLLTALAAENWVRSTNYLEASISRQRRVFYQSLVRS